MTELQAAADYFVREARSLSAMLIAAGDGTKQEQAGLGADEDAIFDLASLTKAFTALLVYRLMEEGALDPSSPVTRYAPMFRALGRVPVAEVLGFTTGLETPGRVDGAADRAEALDRLFAAQPVPIGDRPYSDIHAMTLKYVIEGAAGESYMDALRKRLLDPLGMTETFDRVPDALLKRCLDYDREHRIERGRYILREGLLPGMPHDPKALKLWPGDGCPGHAGLFSTLTDMVRFCRGALGLKIVGRESLRDMAKRRTGFVRPDGSCQQYLGAQCYIRHPIQTFSEVPGYMSDQAVAWSGFTGNHMSLDPARGIFVLALGNRVRNRLTVLLPGPGETIMDYGLRPDGTGEITWPDGERVISSVRYVYLRDEHLHAHVARALGLADPAADT